MLCGEFRLARGLHSRESIVVLLVGALIFFETPTMVPPSSGRKEELPHKSTNTYRSIGIPESLDLLCCLGKHILRSERLQDLEEVIPKLFVVLV